MNRQSIPTIYVVDEGLGEMLPRGSTISINSPFWESSHIGRYITVRIVQDILSRKNSHTDKPIAVLFWTFLLGKFINCVDPQGNMSGHQGLRQ